MATVPVPNVAEVEVRTTLDGQPIENTLYAEFTGTITNAILLILAQAIEDWFHTNLLPILSDHLVMREVYVHDLSSGSGLNATSNTHSGAAGAITTVAAPGQVAWVVKFLTGLAGRSFRGRNYVPGLSSTYLAGDFVTSTWANLIVGAYQMLLGGGGVLPDDWQWGVVSRFHAGAPRVTGLFTPVNGVGYTDLICDTQRNRLH